MADVRSHAWSIAAVLSVCVSALADTAVTCIASNSTSAVSAHAPLFHKAMAALTSQEQRQLFAVLPSDLKAAVWRHQLTAHVAKNRDDLTEEQLDVIRAGVAIIDSGIFEIEPTHAAWPLEQASLNAIRERAVAAFGHGAALALFARVTQTGHSMSQPADAGGVTDTRRPPGPIETLQAECTCSYHDDWCGAPYGCTYACACLKSNWGCGTFFASPCNGTCHRSDFGLPPYCP